ncbi:MAG TPA: hypothetical protein VHG71_02255 [Verrucomicrobiae bacterium]|nr:hypothetical protein [Verrucomicrobiae bacterium]
MTHSDLSKLNVKERIIYSCVIILWGVACFGSTLAGGLIVSFLLGLVIGLHLLPDGNWVILTSTIVSCIIMAAWCIADHRRDFMRRSALSVVGRLKKEQNDT